MALACIASFALGLAIGMSRARVARMLGRLEGLRAWGGARRRAKPEPEREAP